MLKKKKKQEFSTWFLFTSYTSFLILLFSIFYDRSKVPEVHKYQYQLRRQQLSVLNQYTNGQSNS
jgi:hypothetical protein